MVLPNMTMRSIYMDYYNQLNKIEGNASRYVPVYELYDSNRSLNPLCRTISSNIWDNSPHRFSIRSTRTLSVVLSTSLSPAI